MTTSPGSAGTVVLPTPEDTRAFGRGLAAVLRPGDLVLLTGDLGAGKTTLAQGLGEGLGVRGPVTSPTFVLARVHPSTVGGPALVHVDAYRLSGLEELEDLDLDTDLAESVTVVEWGHGVAEQLSQDRLEVLLRRSSSDDVEEQQREVTVAVSGPRWEAPDQLAAVLTVLRSVGEHGNYA